MSEEAPLQGAQLRLLHTVMRRVRRVDDFPLVLDEITAGVAEVLGYGVAAIVCPGADGATITSTYGPAADCRTLVESDLREHPERWQAPIVSPDGDQLGRLVVGSPCAGASSATPERDLLEMFAFQAGLAVDRAHQQSAAARRAELDELVRSISASAKVTGLESTLESSLQVAADVIQQGFGATRVCVHDFGYDRPRGHEVHVLAPTMVGDAAVRGTEQATVHALARLAWSVGAPVVAYQQPPAIDGVGRLRADGLDECLGRRAEELLAALGANQFVVAAIAGDKEMAGHLAIAKTVGRPGWSDAELHSVGELAQALSRVLRNSRLYERQQELVQELRELTLYRAEMVATLSHELKTPLTSIVGHLELLEEELENADTDAGSLAAIQRSAHRMTQLVLSLTSYSETRAGHAPEPRSIDLRELVSGALGQLRGRAKRERVALKVVSVGGRGRKDSGVWVRGDADQLATVVTKLAENAITFTPPGGSVTVTVKAADGIAEVRCADTGIGISAGDRATVFSPFGRSTNPDALAIPGAGLGLAISRRIAQLHGGSVDVDSELGCGSTFVLRLPAEQRAEAS